jgi:hypothetical protein
VDLVYIVGPGSSCDDQELRFSIRSMQKHLSGINKLVIVGHRPSFLNDLAIHIPADDQYADNPARNIYEKILLACRDSRVSAKFICASDDYFLLKDFQATTFPFFHCGDLSEMLGRLSPQNYYHWHVKNTYEALLGRGLPTLNFNVHAPVIYDKALYRFTMGAFNWNIKAGYISKSIYCNALRLPGIYLKDPKIHTPKMKAGIIRHARELPMFSTNEYSMNADMGEVLRELFPNYSRWENIAESNFIL